MHHSIIVSFFITAIIAIFFTFAAMLEVYGWSSIALWAFCCAAGPFGYYLINTESAAGRNTVRALRTLDVGVSLMAILALAAVWGWANVGFAIFVMSGLTYAFVLSIRQITNDRARRVYGALPQWM